MEHLSRAFDQAAVDRYVEANPISRGQRTVGLEQQAVAENLDGPPEPTPVLEGVRTFINGSAKYAFSNGGTFVYTPGEWQPPGCEMRSYAHLWALLHRGDTKTAACPAGIDRLDHIGAKTQPSGAATTAPM